jgi:ABC-type amino acid transport substrate-binding protein
MLSRLVALAIPLSTSLALASTACAQELAYASKLVSPGTITIATTGNAPPMTTMGGDGTLTGFDVELCRTVATGLKLKTEFVRVDFAATIPGLKSGRFDMICSATARTPQRLASPDLFMTEPTVENFSTLLVKAEGATIAAVGEAKGKTIGVVRGGQEGKLLSDLFGEDVTVTTYPGIAEEILDLKNGRIDAVAINYITASHHVHGDPALKILVPGFERDGVSPYTHALIVSRSQPELLEAVNGELARLKQSGELAKLQETWIGRN